MSRAGSDAAPRVFLLQAPQLLDTRRRVFEADPSVAAADQRLLEEAEAAAGAGPYSVVDKDTDPPSGDRHDYLSHAPDWWPDPDRPDGLPWVWRDGEPNPERELHDREALGHLLSSVTTLATAYFFSDHERFAERAGLLLRTWFLDPARRMNPNLDYAQGIPGRCEGRGHGTIDTSQLVLLVDAVGLLGASTAWSGEDREGLRAWCREFLAWLVEGDRGREAAAQQDHHGTWYDAQVLALALFTGDEAVSRSVAEGAPQRLEAQIEADGRQPHELARARSLSCSVTNLAGLFHLADLAAHRGVDLWRHEGARGRSLRRALDWLVDSALDSAWIHPQTESFDAQAWLPLLRRAALRFDEPAYEARIGRLQGVDAAADRTNLLYPALEPGA